MSAGDVPVLDPSVLDELAAAVNGDRGFVVDLIEAFLADGALQVDAIAVALAGDDAEALVRPAHTLKSSSATLGAVRLSASARTLEMAGRSGSLRDMRDGVDANSLRAEWDAAQEALRGWVEETRGS